MGGVGKKVRHEQLTSYTVGYGVSDFFSCVHVRKLGPAVASFHEIYLGWGHERGGSESLN